MYILNYFEIKFDTKVVCLYMHINAVYNLRFITCVIFCFMLQLPQGNDDVIVAKCRSTSGFIGSCIDSPCSPQLQVRARTARIDVKTAN